MPPPYFASSTVIITFVPSTKFSTTTDISQALNARLLTVKYAVFNSCHFGHETLEDADHLFSPRYFSTIPPQFLH